MYYIQNTNAVVPIRMLNSIGAPVSALSAGAVTASLEKADRSTYSLTTSGNWTEVTAGQFNGQGKYDLTIPSSMTNLVGPISVAVSASGVSTFIGVFQIIPD